ncbi:CHAP domain-containing protein [uncultured Bifidobacterium sp.]|uniref:CHAP domain-containing protein n=1 Tax=uncultured Bifidobacterium sp. TaxID=165187 RepID=UPI002604355E|nr:CHAP domain-containing protein [uncultured Bifidobacterium sp.]
MPTANDVLAIAAGEIGYSRWDDPNQGTKYGRWYAGYTGDSYYGTNGVPYCAMFTSWVLFNAGVSAEGLPGAYVPWILSANRDAGRLVYNEDALPGDLVMFDWNHDGVADHIGLVEVNHPDEGWMQTVEGNTSPGTSGSQSNGGGVYRRARNYSSIIGVARPYYNEDSGDDDEMTEEQANWLWTCMNQLTSGYDPTGRDVNMNDHDHLKWIAAKQAKMEAKLDAICEALNLDPSAIEEKK